LGRSLVDQDVRVPIAYGGIPDIVPQNAHQNHGGLQLFPCQNLPQIYKGLAGGVGWYPAVNHMDFTPFT